MIQGEKEQLYPREEAEYSLFDPEFPMVEQQ